jgi:uncharacterized protein (DUF1015 family)
MVRVAPFPAVRPARDKAHLVASRSYISYSKPQLRNKLHDNPFSFLHIIHPDLGSKTLHKSKDLQSRFQMVRSKYEQFINEEILVRENKPCFYIYRQIKNGHPFTGIVSLVSVDDYLNGKIKKHEFTLAKREETFTNYLAATKINAEPVLLISEPSLPIESIYARYLDTRPEYDFTTTNKVRHQFWVIEENNDIEKIQSAYAAMPALYIADGHHRSASSARLFQTHPELSKAAWCLAYILDEASVRIYEFNRLVKDLNGLQAKEFLQKLSADFYIHEAPEGYKPGQKGEFTLYLDKNFYSLQLKFHRDDIDAQVLSDLVLSPILGIHDLRKDKRIAFAEGPKGHSYIQQQVDRGLFACGFMLYPVAMSELKKIADLGMSMPPKSTWVEPKLRSGLVIYEL